jgi:hypothetical protein
VTVFKVKGVKIIPSFINLDKNVGEKHPRVEKSGSDIFEN